MRTLSDFEGIEKGNDMVVICCGNSITQYKKDILQFIEYKNASTIGMNKMTRLITPKYHLWTNKKRWMKHGHVSKKKSVKLIGGKLDFENIKKNCKGECVRIDHSDKKDLPMSYKKGFISGFFRSTGNLSIMLCHIMGAKNIYAVGLDGLTLHPKKDYDSLKAKHHCEDYGSGNTSEGSWDRCVRVDSEISHSLKLLNEYGVKFEIITPTKFKEYYNPTLLREK